MHGIKMVIPLLFAAAVAISAAAPGRALAQEPGEGVLHNLARAVLAVPKAVVRSMKGGTQSNSSSYGYGSAYGVSYPQGYGTVPAGTVRVPEEAVAPTVELRKMPRYITYNMVIERPVPPETGQEMPVIISGPLPFERGGFGY